MKIQIRARLRPFSHTPGTSCVIPRTRAILTAFPTRLLIDQHEVFLPITGPVKNFTVCQDLERDCIFVHGSPIEGYFKLRVLADEDGFEVKAEKGPIESIRIRERVVLSQGSKQERLSLGSHKTQDWDLIKRRKDLKEILPILYFLGQNIPEAKSASGGTAALLKLPKERKYLEASFLAFVEGGFSDLLVPRLFDNDYQGFSDSKGKGDPFYLLRMGSELIRSLFFQQNQNKLLLLPNLPISFHAGRMMGIQAPGVGSFDLEWSKKRLKKVILRASETKKVTFELQKEIKRFRVNRSTVLDRTNPIQIMKNKTYFFDRFVK